MQYFDTDAGAWFSLGDRWYTTYIHRSLARLFSAFVLSLALFHVDVCRLADQPHQAERTIVETLSQ